MILDLLVLGFVIGANNLATALSLGALGQVGRRVRVVVVFGAFEFSVPLVGIWLGRTLAQSIQARVGWLGAALLITLGLSTVAIGIRHTSDDERLARLATTWGGLTLLAMGLSVDNLVIGFSLGLGDVKPLQVAATIMVFSVLFTWVGMGVGASSRRHWERYSEIGAGVLLIALGGASAAGWI